MKLLKKRIISFLLLYLAIILVANLVGSWWEDQVEEPMQIIPLGESQPCLLRLPFPVMRYSCVLVPNQGKISTRCSPRDFFPLGILANFIFLIASVYLVFAKRISLKTWVIFSILLSLAAIICLPHAIYSP